MYAVPADIVTLEPAVVIDTYGSGVWVANVHVAVVVWLDSSPRVVSVSVYEIPVPRVYAGT